MSATPSPARWRRAVLAAAVLASGGAAAVAAAPAEAAPAATSAASRPAVAAETAAPQGALTGFGATLAAFRAANREDVGRCAPTACFGPLVASEPPSYEFSYLTVERGRVVGYSQALPRGTPLLQAELRVVELFPPDAKMSEVQVVPRDAYGASCAVFDVQSQELSRLFGKHAFGDDGGNVGVELATLGATGKTTYNPRSIDLAIVMPSYADNHVNC